MIPLLRTSPMFDSIEVIPACTLCGLAVVYPHVFTDGGKVVECCDACYSAACTPDPLECEICESIIVDAPIIVVDDFEELHVLCSVRCRKNFTDNQLEAAYEHATTPHY